jgi:hypothetical protein
MSKILVINGETIADARGVSMMDIYNADHIHSASGKCLKKRDGIFCDAEVSIPQSLIEDIDYHLTCYNRSTDKANAGHHLIELFNKVSDLSTYHSGYDHRTGTLPWEREDIQEGNQ